MEGVILLLILFIFIIFYKYKVKVKDIKDLNSKLLFMEKECEKSNIEYDNEKEHIKTINNLSIDIKSRNENIKYLKSLLESEKREKSVLESKIIYLEKKSLDIGKELIKVRNDIKEKEKISRKTNKDKLEKNNLLEIEKLKSIIEDKNIEISNLINEKKVNEDRIDKLEKNNLLEIKKLKDIIEDKNIEINNIIDEFKIKKTKELNKTKNNIQVSKFKDRDEITEKAKSLGRDNLWNDEAIELNSKIISFDNKNSAAYTRLARCYLVKENYDIAEELYNKVLVFDTKNTIANNGLNNIRRIKEEKLKDKFDNLVRYLDSKFKKVVTIDKFDEEFLIFYNDIYNPYRYGENERFRGNEDGSILRLKNNNKESIDKYSSLINLKLKNIKNIIDSKDVLIMSIPSSTVGKRNGINIVAEFIAKENKFLDKSNRLIRTTDIPKLATGGRRHKDVHLNSIKYEKDECDLSDKIIILIDDVITTANSLIATREILIKYGAKHIIALGLTRTYNINDEREENIWSY